MATFAYLRVSTHEQTVENQRLEIMKGGFTPDYFFCDEGVSGSSAAAQRPQFRLLLDRIRSGETLVVTKLDRLGRDAHDVGATLKGLAGRGISVIVIQLGRLDLTSPAGRMMLTMLGAVAEMERDLLIERTHAGLDRARSQGKTLGRPAKIAPEGRRALIELRQAGASISALARRFTVSRATISRIVEVEAGATQAGQTTQDSPAPSTPTKPGTRTRKAATGRAGDDIATRATPAQKRGQRRLSAV